jgi:biopolymer transport protein ExbD
MKLSTGRVPDEPEINLVSLIDVVFCIIIFLVVTTTFDQRSAIKLVLPTTQANSEIDPGKPLVVVVDADGRYFVGNNEVLKRDVDSLRDAIAQAAGTDRERPVVLRSDARTPVQAFMTAMDALSQLGFKKISIATKPEAKP